MRVPILTAFHSYERFAICGRESGQVLSVCAKLNGIAPEAVQINVEPPDGVVDVGLEPEGRKVDSSCADPTQNHAVVTESPFNNVIVVGSAKCGPQDHFLPTAHLTPVLPQKSAVVYLLADVAAKRSAAERGRTIRRADRGQRKAVVGHIVIAAPALGIWHENV